MRPTRPPLHPADSGRVDTFYLPFNYIGSRQGSSVVEQGTHKPLVGSSTLPSGTSPFLLPNPRLVIVLVLVIVIES
jgi:hypothetical protein